MQTVAWPWAGALTGGLAFIPAVTVTLFLLAVVDRATSGWTRRIALAALFLMLFGVAVGIVSGHELRDALLEGIVGGATTLAFAWLGCATTCAWCRPSSRRGSFSTARRQRRWPRTHKRWIFLTPSVLVTIALAWLVTRYVMLPRPHPLPHRDRDLR